MMNDALLQVRDVSKFFPGVKALDKVQLTVHKGEVHALMGENGAGKSTLIKILSGIYIKDEGTVYFDGKEINPTNNSEANADGISTIFQELDLIPTQSVYENMYIGREPMTAFGLMNRKKMKQDAERILKDLGLSIDVTKSLKSYSTAVQQMISIARAVSINAKLVIMDEPTSSLDSGEVEVLFNIIRGLKKQGIAIIFISHKMDEIHEICDRLTIFRDGQYIDERDVDKISQLELVSLMIGEEYIENEQKAVIDYSSHANMIELENVHTASKKLGNVNVQVKKGEIVGLAGLLGSGRTEIAKLIFGMDAVTDGQLKWKDSTIEIGNQADAIKMKIGFVTENRKAEGIFPNLSVKANMTIGLLDSISKNGLIDFEKENEIVEKYIKRLRIKTPSANQPIGKLSGGNQQKVLLARWMSMNPEMIILDEPTRGIDVGAKKEIENLIQELSDNGISIIMISSEISELVRNCDRIFVMRNGSTIDELVGQQINQDDIMASIAKEDRSEAAYG